MPCGFILVRSFYINAVPHFIPISPSSQGVGEKCVRKDKNANVKALQVRCDIINEGIINAYVLEKRGND